MRTFKARRKLTVQLTVELDCRVVEHDFDGRNGARHDEHTIALYADTFLESLDIDPDIIKEYAVDSSFDLIYNGDDQAELDALITGEHEEWSRKYNEVRKIGSALMGVNIGSAWSMDFNLIIDNVPFSQDNCKWLSYEANILPLPSNPTYRDVWVVANTLIRMSGDTHHIFIEGVKTDPARPEGQLQTGS